MSRSAVVLALALLATPAFAAPAPTPAAPSAAGIAGPETLPVKEAVMEPATAERVQVQERSVEVRAERQERSTSYRAIYLIGIVAVIVGLVVLIS